MDVSIVILNYNNPHIIEVCLRSLKITEGVDYEVIVVDNASPEPGVVDRLEEFKAEGLIDKLVLNRVNGMFAGGNNAGVRVSDSASKYVLLLNSDVGFLRSDWLSKAIAWMEDTIEYEPSIWRFHPTEPKPGPKDVISIGWSYDPAVEPSHARPEGWCCLIRHNLWSDISPDFPWHYGFEEMLANTARRGARIGVLSQYGKYLVHAEGGSGTSHMQILNKRTPDIPGWFRGLEIETLDFTLGPNEHQSYLWW